MKFQVIAKVEKVLWSNEKSYMYKILEPYKESTKSWVLFAQQVLPIGETFNFEGYISESKDKKRVTSEQKPIYVMTFNAESITESSEIPF